MANVLDKRISSETTVLRGIYQNLLALKNYDAVFLDKVQRLFDS